MDRDELRGFCNLLMVSDPWPTSQEERLTLIAVAERYSRIHGFESWIEAYQKLGEE